LNILKIFLVGVLHASCVWWRVPCNFSRLLRRRVNVGSTWNRKFFETKFFFRNSWLIFISMFLFHFWFLNIYYLVTT
jgi:hypothetical protein